MTPQADLAEIKTMDCTHWVLSSRACLSVRRITRFLLIMLNERLVNHLLRESVPNTFATH